MSDAPDPGPDATQWYPCAACGPDVEHDTPTCPFSAHDATLETSVLQAVLDAIKGTLDPHTQIADHPNVKFAQMERLKLVSRVQELEREVARLKGAAETVLAQFAAINDHQHKLLVEGQTLESASENWDEATLGQSIDFQPLIDALKVKP